MNGYEVFGRLNKLLSENTQTILCPVGADPIEHQRWLDQDLASMIDGFYGEVLLAEHLDERSRARAIARLPQGWALPSVCEDRMGTRWWLLDEGRKVGTLLLSLGLNSRLQHISSLYLLPGARGRGLLSL